MSRPAERNTGLCARSGYCTRISLRLTWIFAGTYPPDAKLKRWQRTVTLNRGRKVEVVDDYALKGPVRQITFSLLTPCEVKVGTTGEIILSETALTDQRRTGAVRLEYEGTHFTVRVEEIPIEDTRLTLVWGKVLRRILFVADDSPQQGVWKLGIERLV